MGDVHRGETTNVMYAGRIAEVGHPGDHVKTVHEGIFISYGLRSFGLACITLHVIQFLFGLNCITSRHCNLRYPKWNPYFGYGLVQMPVD